MPTMASVLPYVLTPIDRVLTGRQGLSFASLALGHSFQPPSRHRKAGMWRGARLPTTVRNHVQRIFTKLGVHSKPWAVGCSDPPWLRQAA